MAFVKHRPVRKTPDVVHAHRVAEGGLFAAAFHYFFDFEFAFGRHFGDVEKFDVKHQRCVSRNGADAGFAVPHFGRNRERTLAAHLHAEEPLVPTADHHAGAHREFERLLTGHARIKHRTVRETPRIVHADFVARLHLGAVTDRRVHDLQFCHFSKIL